MRANIATMKDVARMANVSIATVSLVINDGRVRDTTRARVEDAIRKLRYIPQNHGRGLRSGRSHAIGLYVMNSPDVDDLSTEAADFWFQLIRGVQAICQENEYYFSFESLTWREPERLVRRALSRLNDGAIIVPQYHRHYSFLSELESFKYPYVMYNPCVPVGATHSVFAMDQQAQRDMTAYLIAAGRSSIAFVAGPPEHVDAQNRYSGYREAIAAARGEALQEQVFWSDFTMRGGYEAAETILDRGARAPDAIACANDYLAVGVVHALHDHGVRVPDDVAVTGFGDHDVGRSVIPRLTTVALPTREIGAALGSKLFAQIRGVSRPETTRFKLALQIHASA